MLAAILAQTQANFMLDTAQYNVCVRARAGVLIVCICVRSCLDACMRTCVYVCKRARTCFVHAWLLPYVSREFFRRGAIGKLWVELRKLLHRVAIILIHS